MEFPKGFFREEEREGFTVCELMKRAWGAQLEVEEVLAEICDRHNLKWFATYGTLLGTIRHKGFIPWDDDTDLAMLREDYNELIPYLHEELPEGFSVAGTYAKNTRLLEAGHTPQLRVIADEECFSFPTYLNRFHGFPYFRIGVDFFPLDPLPRRQEDVDFLRKTYHAIHFTLQNWDLYEKDGILKQRIREIERVCQVKLAGGANIKNELWLLLDEVSMMGMQDPGEDVTIMMFTASDNLADPCMRYKKSWFDKQIIMPFEHITMPVPCGYEGVLRSTYGEDYMTPKINLAGHDYPFYKKQEAELKEMFKNNGIDKSVEEFCRNWEVANGRE